MAFRRKLHVISVMALCVINIKFAHADNSKEYTHLIIQARSGNTQPVLQWLNKESSSRPLSSGEVSDWIQISTWAGDNQNAISIWKRYSPQYPNALPERALLAVARAFHSTKQYSASIKLWNQVLAMSPGNDEALNGLIFTLADDGQYSQAISLAEKRAKTSGSAQHWRELAWVQQQAGRFADALDSIQRARQYAPDNHDIQCDESAILASNRMGELSLDAAKECQAPERVTRTRQLAAGAELVRRSLSPSMTSAERFVVADRALSFYNALLQGWKNDPSAKNDYRAARIDRLGALLARHRYKEITAEYRDLSANNQQIPAYALSWVADAYEASHQPAKSVEVYNQIAKESPQTAQSDITQASTLFYALSESGDFKKSSALAHSMAEHQPYYLYLPGSPVPIANDQWLNAQQLLVQDKLNQGDLASAQRMATHQFSTAPSNQGLGISLAGIYESRMWPRRSEALLKRVEAQDPRNIGLEVQQGMTAMDLQEWQQLDDYADDVIARQPENPSAKRLNRLRDVHHMMELQINANYGLISHSNAVNSRTGNHDAQFDAVLYSPPIDENWRIFSGYTFGRGEFREGTGIQNNQRIGAEFTNRGNWVQAYVGHYNDGNGSSLGGGASAWHDFDDHWRIGGSLARYMDGTPLRALHNGISANGGSLYVRWRQNEQRSVSLGTNRMYFSDHNHRQSYSLSGQQRLYTGANATLDFTPEIDASWNSRPGRIYYSPARDLSVVPALSLDHVLYRSYKTEWHQQFVAGAGMYSEKGYGQGAITTLGYGQRISWNDVLNTGVMLSWSNQPYDRERDQDLTLSFDMSYRF